MKNRCETDSIDSSPEAVTTTSSGGAVSVSIGTATATDLFPVTVTNNAPAAFPVGTTTVTWTATDANGNVSTATQLVTVSAPAAVEAVYWHHNDHLGTPQAMTDVNGTVVWKADYTPFGIATVNEDPDGDGITVTNNFRFPGQYFDAETGLNYNYQRTYDPATGRYTQHDPIGLAGGMNPFGYVGANPITGIDPYGLLDMNASIGAGGSGMFMMMNGSADSGVAFDTNGSVCFYSTICIGAGPQTPLGGQLGLVGSVGEGGICSGQVTAYGVSWTGGEGLVGQGQILSNSSFNRGIFGVGGSPDGAMAGGAGIQCTTTYICPIESSDCQCKGNKQ